jgi:hypothetical protein
MRYVILILIMVTVWGLLTKSLTDSETIEEMVDRKIAEHEENPEAHMGDGESIDVHRKTDIVDHKVGSVVYDKTTMKEFVYTNSFDSLTGFNTGGDVDVNGENALYLYIESGAVENSFASKEFFRPSPFMTTTKDFLLQFLSQMDFGNNNQKVYLGYAENSGNTGDFIGFYKNGATLKARVKIGASTVDSSAITCDTNEAHVYRIQHIAGENKFYFFIDGVNVATISYTGADPSTDGYILFRAETNGTADGYVYILDMRLSRATI